jgi:DNA-binding sugar fermentation-stimulating protein
MLVNIDSQAPNKVVKEWLMKQGMIVLNQSMPLEIIGENEP